MPYSVRIEKFEGPLDLLLQLVEQQELEITEVSLMEVTEPFVQHVRENQGKIPPEELADFLVVAARLIYLKSKAILPGLLDPALEEGPDLETQLRMYKAFVEAAARLGEMAKDGVRSFSRTPRSLRDQPTGFLPPPNVTMETLHQLYARVVQRLQPMLALPKAAIERVVTIEEKIEQLTTRVKTMMRVSFHKFMGESRDRGEVIVSFLALLELIKQRIVKVEQKDLFHEIQLEAL